MIVFSYRIYQSKKYLRVAARHLITEQSEDSRTEFEQFCYHYQTEIRKYAYLLLISLSETSCMILYCLTALVDLNYITFPEIANSTKLKLSECSKIENKMLLEFQYSQVANPIRMILTISQSIVEWFVLVFSVCLMKYLTQRIKNTQYPSKMLTFRLFFAFTAISVFMIGIVWVQYSAILLILTVLPIYYYIFVRAVKQFEYTLLQSANERLAQFGSNKEEVRQYKYFKYTIRTVCCGELLIMLSRLLAFIPGFLTSLLFFRNCKFPFNLISNFIPTNSVHISILIKVLSYIWSIATNSLFLGSVILIFPFTCITLCIWVNSVYNSIRGKSKKTYRYNTDNLQALLIRHYS